MSKSSGNAIAQYAIIIGLVAIALVPVFIVTGNSISKFFSDYNSTMADNNSTIANNTSITPTSTATSYTPPPPIITTGTPTQETPQLECSGTDCKINFGDYVLDGIPADFSSYVNSAGSAGGTEMLSDVLVELAEEANISEETKSLIIELANSGHGVASAQSSVQSIIENDVPATAWVSGMYSMLEEGSGGPYDNFLNNKEAVEALLAGASTQDQENIKAIIDVLSSEIISLNNEFTNKCSNINSQISTYSYYNDETILLKDIVNLKPTGKKTDIDSAIICKTGNGKDQNGQCN